MDEHQLRVMFEDFGPVFQINVLRDKITGQSKGKSQFTHAFKDAWCCNFSRIFVIISKTLQQNALDYHKCKPHLRSSTKASLGIHSKMLSAAILVGFL